MTRILAVILLLCLFVTTAYAEVKTIPLQHRPAAELVGPIRELLDGGEKVQAAGSSLILMADGESLQAAEALIKLLDRPPLVLDIRLRHAERRQLAGEEGSVSLATANEHSSISTGNIGWQLGTDSEQLEQSLRVMEGESGWLELGRDIPYTSDWAVLSGESQGYSKSIAYQRIAIGFQVRPLQVMNGQVIVEIMPQFSKLEGQTSDPPQLSFSQLRTKLVVPFGTWVPLAAQLRQEDRVGRAIISWRSAAGDVERELFLRIDPAAGFSP
jgi:hypothetical protein